MTTNPKNAGYDYIQERIFQIIEVMEAQHLTSVELTFKNGWKFKLVHPKRQKILMEGGNPYAVPAMAEKTA